MSLFRKLIGLLTAAALVTFAVPSMAQSGNKNAYYRFEITKNAQLVNGLPSYRATWFNLAPTGSSTINSVRVTGNLPAGVKIVNPVAQSGLSYTNQFNMTINSAGNQVSVSYMPGIGSMSSWYFDFQLQGGDPPCSSWTPEAYAGNSFSNQFFLSTTQPSILTAGTACYVKLDIDTAPPTLNTSTNPVTPAYVNQNTTAAMSAKFTNSSGNAPFASLILTAPTGFTFAATPSSLSGTVKLDTTKKIATITGITPVAGGASLTVSMSMTVDATCTSATPSWTWSVYASTDTTGFAIAHDPTSNDTTTIKIQTACQLVFGTMPTGTNGDPLPPFTVTETGSFTTNPITITASSSNSSCSVSGTTTVTPDSTGTATFSNLIVTSTDTTDATQSCTLLANASGFPSPGGSTTITMYQGGPLPCGGLFKTYQDGVSPTTDPAISGYAKGLRGSANKDGSQCYDVAFTFTNNITTTVTNLKGGTGNTFSYLWDKNPSTGQPYAAFEYTITWKSENVGASGLPSRAVYFSYDGSSVTQALSCLGPTLPAGYGTLAADVNSKTITNGSTTVADTITLAYSYTSTNSVPLVATPNLPFPIVVGTERMLVTGIGTSANGKIVWNVLRGPGVGGPSTLLSQSQYYDPNATTKVARNVMSTPLPLYAGTSGTMLIAPTCIVEDSWVTINPPTDTSLTDCKLPQDGTPPAACILPKSRIFDIGDITVTRG